MIDKALIRFGNSVCDIKILQKYAWQSFHRYLIARRGKLEIVSHSNDFLYQAKGAKKSIVQGFYIWITYLTFFISLPSLYFVVTALPTCLNSLHIRPIFSKKSKSRTKNNNIRHPVQKCLHLPPFHINILFPSNIVKVCKSVTFLCVVE